MITALCAVPKMRVRGYIAALPSLIKQAYKETIYRVYVTDSLKVIGENMAKYVGGDYISERYHDVEKSVDCPHPKVSKEGAGRIFTKLRGCPDGESI